jgi:hypothetical protein
MTETTMRREPLPTGKINIRFRQMRGVYQAFAGRTYLAGCSGDYESDAAAEICLYYEVPEGTLATVHGYTEKLEIPVPTK